MIPMAILFSGEGTNLQALIDAVHQRRIYAEIRCVISNKPQAHGLDRARAAGIETLVIGDADRTTREEKTLAALQERGVELVCLAGYMRVLSEIIVGPYLGRILNIHPSLLPAYRGANTHRRVLEAGEKHHGCSVHFVTVDLDEGPLIIQASVPVHLDDTERALALRVLEQEHLILPLAVQWYCDGLLRLQDGAVHLRGEQLDEPLIYEAGP